MKKLFQTVFLTLFLVSCSNDKVLNSNQEIKLQLEQVSSKVDSLSQLVVESNTEVYKDSIISYVDNRIAYALKSITLDDHNIDYVEYYTFSKSDNEVWDLQFSFNRVVLDEYWEDWQDHYPESISPLIYYVEGNILFESGTNILMTKEYGNYFSLSTRKQQMILPDPASVDKFILIGKELLIGSQSTGATLYKVEDKVVFDLLF